MNQRVLLAASLCGAVMFSCSDNDENVKTPPVPGQPTEISIEITTGSPTRANETVPGTDEESAVKVIEFYVFDDGVTTDPEVGDEDNPGYLRVETSGSTEKIIVTSGDNKKFVTVVNMELGGLGKDGTYTDLKKLLSNHEFEMIAKHNSRDEEEGGFEMSGETVADIEPEKQDNPVKISVDRVVSKINAPLYKNGSDPTGVILTQEQVDKLWGKDCGIDPDDISFSPLGYAVVNGLSRSDAFFISNASGNPQNQPWNNWSWDTKDYLNSTYDNDGFYTNNYSGKGSPDWFLDGSKDKNEHRVYVHENKPKKITVNNQRGYDPLNTYAIMLKGELKVKGDDALTRTRYWRVNLTRTDDYHIMRNYVYDVYIQNIKTIGHPNPKEAEEEDKIIPGKEDSAADVEIKVNDWGYRKYEAEV